MRRVIAGVGIFIILVIAALLVFAATFEVNRHRGAIQSDLEKRLGRSVTLGDMHLNVFPPRVRVQNLAISDDPRFSPDAPFVKAQELDVSVKLMPLLHKDVEVNSLNLQRPTVNLIRNASGVWNVASLGQAENTYSASAPAQQTSSPQRPSQKPSPNAPASSSPERQFSLGELTIADGQLSVLDQQKSKSPSLYDHIDIKLKNFSPDRSFTVDAALHMSGSGSEEARLQGVGGPIVSSQPATTPFRGRLKLKQVGLADLSKLLNSSTLNGTDGMISGETRINSESGKLTAQGQTQVENAKLHGSELGFPITAQYDLTDDLVSDLLTIRNFLLKLGSTPLQVNGSVNTKPTPADLNLNLVTNVISIAEAAKLAAASGMALSQATTATGNVNGNIQARGAATKPALSGTITANNIQLSGKSIAQPIQIPSVNLNLTPAQIRSNSFQVTSGGTVLNAQLTLRNYLAPTPVLDATVRARNAQLPAILAMAKAYGVTSLDKVSGAGTMDLDMQAAGPVRSLSSEEIMRALNGTIDLNFNNVKYSGANVSHELATIAGFLNPNASQSASGITDISTMTGNIVVKNGIAQTNNLGAVLDIGNVGAVGTANLVDSTLNMRVTAVLSQAASQKAGGTSVGGFMQTALTNQNGELVIPARVTGTLSNPRFAPDAQQIAQMKLKGLVPNLRNPTSGTGALQDLLGVNPRNQAQGQQSKQQQTPVQQLLGILGRKKKPNQQSR